MSPRKAQSPVRAFRHSVRCTAVAFWLVAAFTVFVSGMPALERYEARLFPVVSEFEITDARRTEGGLHVEGTMVKARACRFLRLTAYAGDLDDPLQPRERLSVRFLDQPEDSDRSREPGAQNWGPWRIGAPRTATGPHFFIRVSHACNPLYETHGIYYEADLATLFAE